MEKENIVMSWSGGKDSAYALHHILKENKHHVKYLLTSIYKPNKRVSMHGVPEHLIEKQSESIGIPLIKLYIEEKTHDEYNIKMKEILLKFKKDTKFFSVIRRNIDLNLFLIFEIAILTLIWQKLLFLL